MTSESLVQAGSKLYSLCIAGFVFATVNTVYIGAVRQSYLVPMLTVLGTSTVLLYAILYHHFSTRRYQLLVTLPLIAAVVGAVVFAVHTFPTESVRRLLKTLESGESSAIPNGVFPLFVYLLAVGLIVLGTAVRAGISSYPTPRRLRDIAGSPPLFGGFCTVFGLWAVLFVGISVQRIVVIAPIFEELLKFGLALAVGSVLFDQSLAARVGTAVFVGASFGVVEHFTTYPSEEAMVYIGRILFHGITTVLSVVAYSIFEKREEMELQWIPFVYPMLLHFFSNSFAVISALLMTWVFESLPAVIQQVYWAGAIVLGVCLTVLFVVAPRWAQSFHRPFQDILSDLV